MDFTYKIAIDGNGSAWIGNLNASTLSQFSSSGAALSPATGYSAGGIASSLAIDGSGNVWYDNGSNLYEVVGSAIPVVTPIVANLITPYGTATVNKP